MTTREILTEIAGHGWVNSCPEKELMEFHGWMITTKLFHYPIPVDMSRTDMDMVASAFKGFMVGKGLAKFQKEIRFKSYKNRSISQKQMQLRWPGLPPFECRTLSITGESSNINRLGFEVDQENIDEIIEYFQAAKESMYE